MTAEGDNDAGMEKMDTEQDVMDDTNEVEQEDHVALMQKPIDSDYETILQKLLQELEGQSKPKAARLSHFLQQLLMDQRRHAPHLRNPKLAERHDRLLALLTVFEAEGPVLRGDEMAWCMRMWQQLMPFLERVGLPDGQRREDAPGPSTSQTIEVVDSQEPVEEGGSKKQVVQLENGTQRNMTEQEEQEILENELMEEIAAETMRLEEQRMWDEFHAADLRAWESWAASEDDYLQGKRKRARVQVLVQGQGGRIVRRENWLVGLGQGERLSYTVSVTADEGCDDDLEGDPTATSSTAGPQQLHDQEQASEGMVREDENAKATLPVTGEQPDDMWDENVSVNKDINVEDFMQTPLAGKFYAFWRKGTVTDRLIGQRFGYGVLGRFYSKKLWDDGCFDDVTSDGEACVGRSTSFREEDSFPETQLEAGVGETPAASDGGGDVAASSTPPIAGSAAASGSSTEVAEGNNSAILTGSRQTSLSHWLL